MQKEKETLVMLVGGNPLPNYIVAMHFKPEKIILVHTGETKKVAKNLEGVLGDVLGKQTLVQLSELKHPKNPSEIRRKAKEILEGHNVRMDYTGGTKLMAAQFRLALQEKIENASDAISTYLDGYDNKILFDTAHEEEIDHSKIKLNIEILSLLHGLKEIHKTDHNPLSAFLKEEKANDFAEILIPFEDPNFIEEDISLAGFFYKTFPEEKNCEIRDYLETCVKNIEDSTKIPDKIKKFTRETTEQIKNIENLNKKQLKYISRFFGGNWLELWCQSCIRKIFEKKESPPTIFVGKKYELEKREFEIDVSFVHKMRYFQVSCTIDPSLGRTKTKLFETYVRRRQVGGDLARTALVCFCNGKDTDELKRDVGLAWDDPSKPMVFGLDDLKAWVKGDLSRLEEWCNRD